MEKSSWQECVRQSFKSAEALVEFLQLSCELKNRVEMRPRFPLLVPRRLADKMTKGTLDDPLTRQFLSLKDEAVVHERFTQDPVGDKKVQLSGHVLKKYEGRALMLSTGACAMHCRYCFRQHFPYETQADFAKDLQVIQEDPSISEVILSGGDPLSLSQRVLEELLDKIEKIPHVKRLRWHSRFIIGIPERIDDDFVKMLGRSRLQMWFLIHCNHPKELDADVACAIKKIQTLGIPVLNQAVLLRGVNDEVVTLKALAEQLSNLGVVNYYLNQLDQVAGAAHFEVPVEEGKKLVAALRDGISGYAVPTYVQEVPGAKSKCRIAN